VPHRLGAVRPALPQDPTRIWRARQIDLDRRALPLALLCCPDTGDAPMCCACRRWKTRNRGARPRADPELPDLIQRMSKEISPGAFRASPENPSSSVFRLRSTVAAYARKSIEESIAETKAVMGSKSSRRSSRRANSARPPSGPMRQPRDCTTPPVHAVQARVPASPQTSRVRQLSVGARERRHYRQAPP
jgi:hypothetical protein